jgi:hypothetical protein
LQAFNDGKVPPVKSVSVVALEDSSGGSETITFNINGQIKVVQVNNIPANQMQPVSVTHTSSGKGPVQVSAANSPKKLTVELDLDKVPGDDGSGTP